MSCVSNGQKRDKWIMLMSNTIAWEYITVIFLEFFYTLLFTPPLFQVIQLLAPNKSELLELIREDSVTGTWNASGSVWRWHHVMHKCFWVAQKVQRRIWESERWFQKQEAISKKDSGQHQAGKIGGVKWSLVDCSTDCKSAGHKKGLCLEDNHQRFQHVESLCKNYAKIAEWWSEGSPHASSIFLLNQICFVESSLVMRIVFLSMTWKPSGRVVSGSLWSHQRKQKSKSHGSYSSKREALTTASSCYRARWLLSKSTWRSYGISFTQCIRRDESYFRTNCGCFTLSIWQLLAKRNIAILEQPFYSPDLTLCDFFILSSSKGSSSDLFWRHGGRQEGWSASQKNPSGSTLKHGRKGWESGLDLRRTTLKEKSCNLLFGVETTCLWH